MDGAYQKVGAAMATRTALMAKMKKTVFARPMNSSARMASVGQKSIAVMAIIIVRMTQMKKTVINARVIRSSASLAESVSMFITTAVMARITVLMAQMNKTVIR